jgi:acyl carrier protein
MGDLTEVPPQLTPEQQQLAELLLRDRGIDPLTLPIPRRPDGATAPLSSTQRRLWASGQLATGTAYGNVPMAFRITGSLDVERLAHSVARVIERHEVLRTSFPTENEGPVQRIRAPLGVRLWVEDLRELAAAEREAQFDAGVRRDAHRAFDPAAETLLRVKLFRLGVEDWGLVLVSNHLATDGWGARLLLEELSATYGALAQGAEPALPALLIQYGDYSAWDAARSADGALEAQRRYWLDRLAGAPPQIRLPFDGGPSPSADTETVRFSLSGDLSERLRSCSRARGVTPYITLLAAFKILLARTGGQDDIVVGTIVSRRTRSETESLIGNFGNNLLLRTRLSGDPFLADVVERTAATVHEALANSDVPLELVAESAPVPAFHVMFILRDGGLAERLRLPGAVVREVPASAGASTLDLMLDLTDGPTGFKGHFEFRTARFRRETIEQLASAYEAVLTRLVIEPTPRVSELPVYLDARSAGGIEQERGGGEEPATRTERSLARLWQKALGVERVFRSDRFFELGGDSLRAVYVIEQAERELGYRIRPEELRAATLDELAVVCERRIEIRAAGAVTRSQLTVRRAGSSEYIDETKALFLKGGTPQVVEFIDRAYLAPVGEPPRRWVGLNERGDVVGHIAVFLHRFMYGGVEYTGAVGADLLVDRRYRDLAHAVALVGAAVRDLEDDGHVDFFYGDPNDHGRAIMNSVGGFSQVGVLTRFVLPVAQPGILGPAIGLYARLMLRGGPGVPMEVERREAAAFNPAEIIVPPGEVPALRPLHPLEVYHRRLPGYPSANDDWYLFRSRGERAAAVLVRRGRRGGRAQLCAVWRQPRIRLQALLRAVVADLRARGITRLEAWSLRSSRLGGELRASGFIVRSDDVPFIARPCSPKGRVLLDRRVDWEITDLDCDPDRGSFEH